MNIALFRRFAPLLMRGSRFANPEENSTEVVE